MKKVLAVVLTLALVLGLSAANAFAAEKLTDVSFRLNYIATGVHVPYYYALDHGIFEKYGLNVTIGEGTGSGNTATLIGTGADDIGLSDLSSVASAVAQGIPIKICAPILQMSSFGVITLEGNGIKEPKDLEGKKVGMTIGDGPFKFFDAFCAANGIDKTKLEMVAMDGNTKPAALFNGSVDAVLAGVDNDALQVKALGGNVLCLPYGDWGAAIPGIGIIANEEMMKNHPETITKFISAVGEAFTLASQDIDGGVESMLKYVTTMDPDLCRAGWIAHMSLCFHKTSTHLFDLSDEVWAQSIDILRQYAGIDPSIPYDRFYTKAFLPAELPARW